MMRCGGLPAISRPSKRIEPAFGAKVPDSMLKIVLLPDPFGPISPRISPSPTANETSLTAVKPPNRLKSPVTSSTETRLLRGVGRVRRQLQPEDLPLADRERDVVDRGEAAEPLEEPGDLEHGDAVTSRRRESSPAASAPPRAAAAFDCGWQPIREAK